MRIHLRTNRWLWWYGVLLVASTGCWQEVHYAPDKSLVVTPVVDDLPESPNESGVEVSDTEDPPTADQTDESGEVSADALFGAPEDATPSETATSTGDSENTTEQLANEQGDPESQGPNDSPTELNVEPPLPSDSAGDAAASEDPGLSEGPISLDPIPGTTNVMRPSRTALAVWRMSSRWSFAAAIYAKGQPEESYRDSLEQATYASELVGIELPPFPVSEGIALETAVIGYLLDAGPAAFVNKLSEDYVPEYEAIAELAIRTNALLLVYTPKSQQLDSLISSIRQSAEDSGLPAELWTDLVSMLERREAYTDVKQRVLSFHTEVGDYLGGQE